MAGKRGQATAKIVEAEGSGRHAYDRIVGESRRSGRRTRVGGWSLPKLRVHGLRC